MNCGKIYQIIHSAPGICIALYLNIAYKVVFPTTISSLKTLQSYKYRSFLLIYGTLLVAIASVVYIPFISHPFEVTGKANGVIGLLSETLTYRYVIIPLIKTVKACLNMNNSPAESWVLDSKMWVKLNSALAAIFIVGVSRLPPLII